ncbi:DUF4399 domain-containing protein [Methylobacterium segetis]|uniref:DUF4399 domain-containing protein n=1 Tax=Methylobacterium segetis TaxID=2488750 RepID=UPI001A9D8517|nr:DUF4399 domain-containing protein [Methylobacterium segetis]
MGGATASTHRVRAYRTWICRLGALVALTQAVAAQPAQGDRKGGPTPSAPGAAVYFIDIKDGSILPRKPMIRFGLRNMGVAPAGFDKANTGHHHLLIDAPLRSPDERIPNDFNHLHFGLGQTEAQVTLPLGTHTLQLVLADADHVPHVPPVMSETIKVLVTRNGRRPRVARHRDR